MGVNWKNLSVLLIALGVAMAALSKGLAAGWETAFPSLKNEAWEEECGACHMPFTPGMLPARSWVSTMEGLEDHFGEDATAEPEVAREVTAFLVDNAADNPKASDVMRRIARSIAPHQTLLRITEGEMFKYYHEEIPASIWQREQIGLRSNCTACHTRAEEGRYLRREIQIPKQ